VSLHWLLVENNLSKSIKKAKKNTSL
jgi:hypothetical protein